MDARQFFTRLAKADFADAVGISLSSSTVALAHVRKRFNAVTICATAERPIHVPPEGRWAMIVDFVREFVEEYEIEGARVGVALDRKDVLIGQLQLPAAAAENLEAVVGFEMDRVIPVPADRLYVDHYQRAMGTAGERIGVTVQAGIRERVDEIHLELDGAGYGPSAVMPTPSALAAYYAFCTDERDDGPRTSGIFCPDDDRMTMTVVHDGAMVSSARFDPAREAPAERLRREIENVLPDCAGSDVEIVMGNAEAADDGVTATLATILPPDVLESRSAPGWREAAAIGAAMAQLGEGVHRSNLLPKELSKAEDGVGIREMGLSALVVVLAGTLMGATVFKNLSISNAVASEVDRLKPQVQAVNAQEAENGRILERIKILEETRDQSVLAYLKDMTDRVPKSAYLTTFRFKGDRVEVDGIADNASGLISLLERSSKFKNVEFTAPTTKYLQDQERFSLRMGLE